MFDRIIQWFKDSWAAMEDAALFTDQWLYSDDDEDF